MLIYFRKTTCKQLFIISFALIITGRIVCFGNWNDSLEVSKIFLSVKGNNGRSECFYFFRGYVSWPQVHNPYSPHISQPISFNFSSENLVICQELSSTLNGIIFVPTAVRKQHFNVHSFSWRKINQQTAVFNFWISSEMFLARTRCSVFYSINSSQYLWQNNIYEQDVQYSPHFNRKEAISAA